MAWEKAEGLLTWGFRVFRDRAPAPRLPRADHKFLCLELLANAKTESPGFPDSSAWVWGSTGEGATRA